MAAAFRRLLLRGLHASRRAPAPAPRDLSTSTSTITGGSHVPQGHRPCVRLPHLGVADTPYLGRAARGRVPTTACDCDGFEEALQDYRRSWWKLLDAHTAVGMLFIGALWPIKIGIQAIDPSYENK